MNFETRISILTHTKTFPCAWSTLSACRLWHWRVQKRLP